MNRSRLEDIGRILTRLEYLLEDEIFEDRQPRNKDFYEWFKKQPDEVKDEMLTTLVYHLDNVESKISECILIARGHDDLNCVE